jgi:glucose/arabinose dehydrogenase
MRRLWPTAVLLLAVLWASPSRATVLDSAFTESTYLATGLSTVTGMAWAPDGSNRLFLTRKGGPVRVIENGVLLATPFATISPVYTNSECGVIGIAFDPAFASNGYVYFFVTVSASEQQIIRYTATGNVGGSKTTIVSGLPTQGQNHDGGAIGFGPDGKLYFAIGDNGNGTGVDQNLSSLAAKISRVNPDGSTPNDNPFFDGAGPNADRIWARGFRNPYTLTWQPSTERMWVNTVGTSYEQVFTPQAGDHAGWNDYESNQPSGFLAPVISYRTNQSAVFTIAASGAVRQNGVTTFTTTAQHRIRPGTKVTVAGVANTSFNATAFVSAVPSPSAFSIPQAGTNATSGGGSVTTLNIGGAILGGTFWDSSGVPGAYRDDFFFGDYNSDQLVRATLEGGAVTSVDIWGQNIANYIDAEVGPDGNLYYVNYLGTVYRAAYTFGAQALVVSRLNVRAPEGGTAAFNVRLARAPASNVSVAVARISGDSDVSVAQGASLTFTTGNWSTPQLVRLAAAQDADSIEDTATIAVSSAGLATENVVARVTDDDQLALIVSQTSVTFTEGATGGFAVSLSGPPATALTVSVARTAGDADVTVSQGAQLSFSSGNWAAPQPVTLSAQEDVDTVEDTATITVSATGLSSRTVAVSVFDNDLSSPQITSTPLTTAVVGTEYSYDVEAIGLPAPSFSLDQAPSGMSIDAGSGLVVWTPVATGTADVVVRATNGITPDDTQSFTIVVSDDQPPTCVITSPAANEALSGAFAEFFGDVLDDVGATKAEFSVDGVVEFTDVGPAGHYHHGAGHNLFDTTHHADGTHVFGMVGYDTTGKTCLAEVTAVIDNGADGGAAGSAGSAAAGGVDGGAATSGGSAAQSGGAPAMGGSGASVGGSSGSSGRPASASSDEEGCACSTPGRARTIPTLPLLFAFYWFVARRRKRAQI